MLKNRFFLISLLVVILLAACNAPVTTAMPAAATAPQAAVALPTALLPTGTMPAPLPTATNVPTTPVVITQLRMLDASNGWGWTPKGETGSELLRTADGGSTWVRVTPIDKPISPEGSFFLDAHTAWVPYFDPNTNASGLLRTSDGGLSWTELPPIENAQGAPQYTFTSPMNGMATTAGVGAGNLYLTYYQTSDGGQTWAPVLLTPPSPEEGLPPGTVHLCNICGDNLYYDGARALIAYGDLANDPAGSLRLALSTDLGQHWQNIKLAYPDPKFADAMVGPNTVRFFGNQGLLAANLIKYGTDGSLAYSALVLYSSTDGGQTWAAQGLMENAAGLYESVQILSPMDAFVRCGPNLCATHDGAKTWQTLPKSLDFDSKAGGPDYVYTYNFIDTSNGWAISGQGADTHLWKSADGGMSWTKLAPGLLP